MTNRTPNSLFPILAVFFLTLLVSNGSAQKREWNDKSGKFKVEAEFVDSDNETVTIKTAAGKSMDVPKAKLSDADLAFVAEIETKKANEAKVRYSSTRFFNSLKKSEEERDEEVLEFITSSARERMEGSGSEIKNLPKPDRAAKPVVKSIAFDGDSAEAVVRLRFKGKSISPTLLVRREEDKWLVYGIIGPDENDEIKTILFEDESANPNKRAAVDESSDKSANETRGTEKAAFSVPDGNAAKLFKFIDQTMSSKPAHGTDDLTHRQQVASAVESAANKILRDSAVSEQDKTKAGRFLVDAAMITIQEQPNGIERLSELAEEINRRGLSDVQPYAESALLLVRARQASSESEVRSVVGDVVAHLSTVPLTRENMALAQQAGTMAERLDSAFAAETYAKFGETFRGGEGAAQDVAERFDAMARRLGLVGQEMRVAGVGPDGELFNYEDYKGKVVLVDFWATWCGPCRQAFPNVLKNYEQYHDKGFEVIAISIDKDLGDLASFMKTEKPPWIVLADTHPKNGESIADYYGIEAIPATFLIGKDGKVITAEVRGGQLDAQLERLLGGEA